VTNASQGPGNGLFTSESVSEGHPDKLADRISDEILDEALRRNPKARVAVETLVTAGRCILAGEVSGVSGLDYAALARRAIRERLGLDRPIYARTAAYGHFGREPDADGGFSWERTDLAEQLVDELA